MRRRTEAKRNAILKVARELFSQKGYQNTSMSEITAKVGGSKATIYGYFKSKKLLFQAVMEGDSLAGVSLKAPVSDDAIQIVPLENYRQIIAIVDAMMNSHDSVKKTLYRFSKNVMQTVCQPAFLEIYRTIERAMERSGEFIFLMLCTIVDGKGNPMKEGPKLTELSERLEEALIRSVRHSDTITKYGSGQYLILLFNTTRGNCGIIQKRINDNFLIGRQRTGIDYSVSSVILPKL